MTYDENKRRYVDTMTAREREALVQMLFMIGTDGTYRRDRANLTLRGLEQIVAQAEDRVMTRKQTTELGVNTRECRDLFYFNHRGVWVTQMGLDVLAG